MKDRPVIRHATRDDIYDLIPLLVLFQEETTYRDAPIPPAEERTGILENLLAQPDKFVALVAEHDRVLVGFCIGSVGSAHMFLPGLRMAVESAWWVRPAFRHTSLGARLLSQFREWGVAHGATYMSFGRPLTSKQTTADVFREEVVRMKIGEHHVR